MIVRSLRMRLLLAIATIVVAVLVAVGLFSSLTARREFDRYLVHRVVTKGRVLNVDLERHYARQGSWRGVEPVLRRLSDDGTRLLLFDAQRKLVARAPLELEQFEVSLVGDELRLVRDGQLVKLRGAVALHAPDGTFIGSLYTLPGADSDGAVRRRFRGSLNRWLLGGVVSAALVAFVVTLLMLRRVFAPVEALTAGARALAGGKLETRVPVKGDDEIGELAGAFNAMAEALERNERARRNMVSDVAHELRTPLTNIRVQIEALQDGVVEPDAKMFASISEDAATLSRLIDDLQQLTLAEAGELRLERADVRLAEVIERAVAVPSTQVIDVDVPDDIIVRVDARRIVQVVRNLVVNAVKHARSRVEVTARRVDGGVEVRVADDGPGIPPEHLGRIFDRFYRIDVSRSRTTGGAGLGLAIAKELVELHGGNIRVTNRESGGAELTVFISS
ncbi:MAG TPA: ATP-binding protein [Thermoanaerobaculia bacterium]|jgi:signal transduction histidine kinase